MKEFIRYLQDYILPSLTGRGRGRVFLVYLLLLSSCGDFWTVDTDMATQGAQMQLSRRVVTIMEGERYAIPVTFTPDSLVNKTVYWEIEDDEIATFTDDTLVALSPGLTRAIATSTVDRLSDTCWVKVMPRMEMSYGNFQYEMMLYASVTLHGRALTIDNADSVVVGAYVGEQLRGVGQMRREHNIDYLAMRIGSNRPEGDRIRLRCYYRGRALAEWFPDTLRFNGEALGTLSQLVPLVIDDDADVYQPDINSSDTNHEIEVPDTVKWVVDPPPSPSL